jgi:hypothetical protein
MHKLMSIGLAALVLTCAITRVAPAATTPMEHPTLACKGVGAKCQLSTQCCSNNCSTDWRCVR